jgi:uncharacterized protein YbaP (TraB family)
MRKRGLLWKLTLDSNAPPGYLFGTMHSAGTIATDKIIRVLPYIQGCTSYFGESDIDQLLANPFQTAPPVWKGLAALIRPPAYARCHHQLKKRFNLDLDAIQHLPPLLLTSLISEKMLSAGSGQALDIQLWMLAKNQGLSVQGLESVEEQAKIYEGIPILYQIRQIKKMVLNLTGAFKSLAKIERAYFRDDLAGLYRLSHRHLGKTKRIILYDRNLIMAQRIKVRMDDRASSCFFALGAAHLPGQKGVLRLLKALGLEVDPV